MKSSYPSRPRPLRPSALTMPRVTVCPSPNGLPIATTKSPTSSESESPGSSSTRSCASMRRSATSVPGSLPTSVASNSRRSRRVTTISSAPLTTWWLVTTRPSSPSMMMPDPMPCTGTLRRPGALKNRLKTGSSSNGFCRMRRPRTEMFTTAGVTSLSTGATVSFSAAAPAPGNATHAIASSSARQQRAHRIGGTEISAHRCTSWKLRVAVP